MNMHPEIVTPTLRIVPETMQIHCHQVNSIGSILPQNLPDLHEYVGRSHRSEHLGCHQVAR